MSRVYEKYYIIENSSDHIEVLDLSDFCLESFFNGNEFKEDFYDLNMNKMNDEDLKLLGCYFDKRSFNNLKKFIKDSPDLFILDEKHWYGFLTDDCTITHTGGRVEFKYTDGELYVVRLGSDFNCAWLSVNDSVLISKYSGQDFKSYGFYLEYGFEDDAYLSIVFKYRLNNENHEMLIANIDSFGVRHEFRSIK